MAWGEVIKSYGNYSFILLRKRGEKANFSIGEELYYTSSQKLNQGRSALNVKQKKVILSDQKDVTQYRQDRELGMPQELIKKKEDYRAGAPLVETDLPKEQSIETTDYARWKKRKSGEYIDEYMQELEVKHLEALGEVVDANQVREKHDEKLHQEMAQNYTEKINKLPHGPQELYEEQKKVEGMPDLREKSETLSVYREAQEERKRRTLISPQAQEKIKREGPMWSAGMDEDHLRRFVVESGLAQEKERQRLAFEEQYGHEFILRYTTALIDQTTDADPSYQGRSSSIGLSYEFYLGKTTQSLRKWSLEVGIDRESSYYTLGDSLNAHLSGIGYSAKLNWYLNHSPAMLRRYLWYLGTGIRRGNATTVGSNLSKEYEYQVFAFPSAHLGLKYRFDAADSAYKAVKTGFGLNALLSYERVNLDSLDELTDDIIGSQSVNDVKLSFGLGFYF